MQAALVYIECSPYPPQLLSLLEHVEALAPHPLEPMANGSRIFPSKSVPGPFNRTSSDEQDEHLVRIRAATFGKSQNGWRNNVNGAIGQAPPRWRSLRRSMECSSFRPDAEAKLDPFHPLPRHDGIIGGFGETFADKFVGSRQASPFPIGPLFPRGLSREFSD